MFEATRIGRRDDCDVIARFPSSGFEPVIRSIENRVGDHRKHLGGKLTAVELLSLYC